MNKTNGRINNSHSCYSKTVTVSGTTIHLKYIKTSASNIKILSFSRKYGTETKKTVSASGEYGINGSWFAINTDNHISNLAYQNGVRQGYFLDDDEVPIVGDVRTDGFTNSIGKSLMHSTGGRVYCAPNVPEVNTLCTLSTWAQGGIGLYLDDPDGYELFETEGEGLYASGSAKRSAMVADKDNDQVYLVATPDEVTVEKFREAIIKNFSIKEGSHWLGILLDGGDSTQLRGSSVRINSDRPIPQMIALIDP